VALLVVALVLSACESGPTLIHGTGEAPFGTPAPGASAPEAPTGPLGREVPVGVGSEPTGWGVLGVEGHIRRIVPALEGGRLLAPPGAVYLVVTVDLQKLRHGQQPVPTAGVTLRGEGRSRSPHGFGQDGRYCVHCRLRNRTTSSVVHLGFLFTMPRAEATKRHVLLFADA
jgi:hypothetical protein